MSCPIRNVPALAGTSGKRFGGTAGLGRAQSSSSTSNAACRRNHEPCGWRKGGGSRFGGVVIFAPSAALAVEQARQRPVSQFSPPPANITSCLPT